MNTPIIDDIIATHEQGLEFRGWVEMDKLATELRALLAERDALRTENATLQAARTPTPPRRLREVTLGALTYRCLDGIVQFRSPNTGEWTMSHSVGTEHVRALADLIANPEEPVPDPTTAIRDIVNKHFTVRDCGKRATACAEEIRAHLATQQGDNENSYPSPEDMACTGKIIRDEFIKAITPEQAVGVLVAHGAKRSTAWNSVIATGGGNDAVLILPTATPEGGK